MAITIGLKTNTHLFICTETTLATDIIKIKDDDSNTISIENVLVSLTGEQQDTFRTAAFLSEYTKLLSLRYRERVDPAMVSRIIATEVHDSLRRSPLAVQGVVGGRDIENTLRLFSIDRYGAQHEDNFVVTGYGLYFLYGVYDRYYRRDMDEGAAMALIRNCLKVLRERLVLDTSKWQIDVIGPNGRVTQMIESK